MKNNFILHFSITGSCSIEDCINQALELAKKLEVIIEFTHDTYVVQISQDSKFEDVLKEYTTKKEKWDYIMEQQRYNSDDYPSKTVTE